MQNKEYVSKLCEYDAMINKAKEIVVLQQDINNFISKKYELLKGESDDIQWNDNNDLIDTQFVEHVGMLTKLSMRELQWEKEY